MIPLSLQIKECRDGPSNNRFQGKDTRVLFVCSMGILRSATAARLYAHKFNTRTCGTWNDALIPLSKNLIEWAEEIVFVNEENYYDAIRKYKDDETISNFIRNKAVVLDIPDDYQHMAPELIEQFTKQYHPI
jgi:predicted protein tyrosine phosphatase